MERVIGSLKVKDIGSTLSGGCVSNVTVAEPPLNGAALSATLNSCSSMGIAVRKMPSQIVVLLRLSEIKSLSATETLSVRDSEPLATVSVVVE